MSAFKKENLFPGLIVQVRTDKPLTNGLPPMLSSMFSNNTVLAVSVHPQNDPTAHYFLLNPGDTCEVMKGPHKNEGSNVVRVKNPLTGRHGFVFWCEFKACCVAYTPPSPKVSQL